MPISIAWIRRKKPKLRNGELLALEQARESHRRAVIEADESRAKAHALRNVITRLALRLSMHETVDPEELKP